MRVAIFRTRILLRNNVLATVALALMAGLAASVPIAAWVAARQTLTALPNFLERSDPPDLDAFFCPPELGDLSNIDPESPEGYAAQAACRQYDQGQDRDELATMPEVASTTRATAVVGLADLGNGPEIALVYALLDPVLPPPVGPGELIAGKWFTGDRADELVISETMAKLRPELSVGSTVTFTPYVLSQGDCAGEGSCDPEGESTVLTVVGIAREAADLAPTTSNGPDAGGTLLLSSAWWDRFGAAEPFRYGTTIQVWAAPGVTASELKDAIDRHFPGRVVQFESPLPDEVTTLDDAIAYEAHAAEFFALVTAIAALMFIGQAVHRQASKEAVDLPILTALGIGRRIVVVAALLRTAVIAFGATIVATLAAYLLSPLGPVGVARRVLPGTHTLDLPIVFCGVAFLIIAVCALGAAPAWLAFRRAKASASEPSLGGAWAVGVLSPPTATGIAAALTRRLRGRSAMRSAIVASACAIAGIVAATTLTATLASVLHQPRDFGVTWDVVVGNIDSNEGEVAAGAKIAGIPGISGAVGIYDGAAVADGHTFPLVGFVPVAGMDDFDPAIVSGRAPTRPGEVALGRNTMDDLGLAIGDEFTFTLIDSPSNAELTATVVGQALLNNTFELEAGTGAVIDPAWIRPLSGGQPQQIAVRISPEANRAEVLAALNDAFPNTVVGPVPPTGLRNLQRIDGIPALLAFVIAALAFAALAHALIVSIRGRRVEFAILRSLGFTSRQVIASARWQAITIGLASIALGVPLGWLLGRWVWRLLSSNIGLSAGPVSSVWPPVAAALGVLVVAALLSELPGRGAVRSNPSVVLRSSD